MSTSRGDDLEQNSPIDLDPLVGLPRPPPSGEIEQSSERPHEESGTHKMSTLQSDLEKNSSIDSETDVSSMTSGEQLREIGQCSQPPHENPGEQEGWKGDLCHAICVNRWNDVKAILDQKPKALTAGINNKGRTALHVAALFGHATIVEELLKLLPPEFLTTLDSERHTAPELATMYSESTQVAKCLVNKSSQILGIPNKQNRLPVIQAFTNNCIEMGRYLYSVTPLKLLPGYYGSKLLHYCFKAQCLDIALDLLQRCEKLLLEPDDEEEEEWTPVHNIASLNTVILSPSELVFWKRWIYNHIEKPSAIAINEVCVDIQQENISQEDKLKLTKSGHGLLPRLITSAYNFVGVKKIQELKLQHAQADVLLGLVCKNARKAYQMGVIYEALKVAAQKGNAEFVFQVSNVIPEIFTIRTFLSCFIEALDNRQAEVFNLIHGLRFKNVVLNATIIESGDTLLHRAAMKAPDHILNRIYAPTLQMQKELQWFKEVQSLVSPTYRGFKNKNGKTAEELFRESHRELMKGGEKWIKATATSCSIVGTLIITIMFAAAFTIPGGNDQNLGYPLFIKQPIFKVFIFSTILSLLSSTTSVLMFLAILTSQYSEKKFLKSLPIKLILGLSFLFFSIVCMMIAFLSTIHLMLKHTHYSWGILPIIIFASVPIFLFVLSQFPLLLHTYVSTYGNIFDRKVMSWPEMDL